MLQGRVRRVVWGIIVVLAWSGAALAQNGRVGGLVREDSGQPVKGATVIAENQAVGQSFTATTDEKGRFNMIGLRSGEWRFIAQAPGYSPEGGMMSVRSGGQNPAITFELKHSGVAYFGALGGITSRELQSEIAAADALYAQRKWDESIAAYRALLAKAPVLTSINLQVGAALRQKKDYDGALAAYAELLKADPANGRVRMEIASTALERGDRATALTTLREAAARPGASRDVFYMLGETVLAGNDAADATTWFQKASDADPYWARPLVRLGEAAMKKGDNASAARLLARAVAVDPTAPDAAAAQAALASLKK